MFFRILGILDLIVAFMVMLSGILPHQLVFLGAMYLILKGGFYALMGDIASFIDIFCGLYIILLAFGIGIQIISIIVVVFLLQKAILSMIFG